MKRVLLILRHTKEQFENDAKYKGIFRAFVNLGFDVTHTFIDGDKIWITDGTSVQEIGKVLFGLGNITRNTSLYVAVRKYIKENTFEYCYIRDVPATPTYVMMLRAIKKSGAKILIEIPTYPIKGEFDSDKWHRKIIRKILENNMKKGASFVDLFLLLGEKADSYLGRPAINIENGVDINTFNEKKHLEDSDSINMVFIGKVARWHGIDRIINGMHNYYREVPKPSREVFFHVIGNDADGTLKSCRELVERYKLGKYISFEGPKYGVEADIFFNISHVAIASLGDHRRKVNNISLLKIKEYMARGIPFVYSMDDNMINENWNFCIKIPKDESPVNINEVVSFALKNIGNESMTKEMRKICAEQMGWENQIAKAMLYFVQK